MKIKFVILTLLLIWCGIWGIDYYKESINILTNYKNAKLEMLSLQSDSKKAKKDAEALYSQITQFRDDKIDISDKVAVTQAICEIEGVSINAITAKRLDSLGESITVATVMNVSDVSNFTNVVSCIEYDLAVTDIQSVVQQLESLKLVYKTFRIIPTENRIIIELQIGG